MQVYDVSIPIQPRWVGSYQPKAEARCVAVSGNYAYLAEHWAEKTDGYGDGGLEVVDIRPPPSPRSRKLGTGQQA